MQNTMTFSPERKTCAILKYKEPEILLLKKIDWDFVDADTSITTHPLHPYPAKFIPQIPHYFIEKLSKPGETIYDPFLGCGTTAVESVSLGRNAIGNDVNELAVLISKVKTTAISNKLINSLDSLIEDIKKIENKVDTSYFSRIEKPIIYNLDLWFKEFVICELSFIKQKINRLKNNNLKNLCLVALSGIIVNVSNQDSDTRYVRVEKNIKPFDTLKRFVSQLTRVKELVRASKGHLKNGRCKFKIADTRKQNIFSVNSADLAITSPPYPNAYDYHLYHKYRLFWLDMDPNSLRRLEIGAHADYSKKSGFTEYNFMEDMRKCFLNISKILKPHKYLVLVIGNSILKGRNVRNNEILKLAAKNTPMFFVDEFNRNLNLRKKSFNPKIGNIKTEKILIFRNIK